MDEASNPQDPATRLAEAQACHDADPARAAALLRGIDPAELDMPALPAYAFLLNHVLGEKEGAWPEALRLHEQALARPGVPGGALRLAAAAAFAAGDAQATQRFTAGYADAARADPARARDLVELSAAACTTPRMAAAQAGRLALALLDRIEQPGWSEASALDAAAAACLNNLAGALQDRPADEFGEALLRDALVRSAELAHRFWDRAGTWVHRERALYLRATVATALGDFEAARGHCTQALALLAANDPDGRQQPVDRAFVELEQAHACRRLGREEEAQAGLRRAQQLAGAFGEPGLRSWFGGREAALFGPPGG